MRKALLCPDFGYTEEIMNYPERKLSFLSIGFIILIILTVAGQSHAGTESISISASRGTEEGRVVIEWDSIPFATGYHIMRSNNYSGIYSIIGWSNRGQENYSDSDAKQGIYYWYKVMPQYWLVPGAPTRRVQGWVHPHMAGGMVEMLDRLTGIISQVPHAGNVKGMALARLLTLPDPDMSSIDIPDNDRIYNWVETVCREDHRRVGSPESKRTFDWLVQELGSILNTDVVIDEIDLPTVYTAETWGLTIDTGSGSEEYPAFYILNTGMTLDNPSGGSVSGDMIWAGAGSPDEFDALGDISGKIVVANCEFPGLPIGLIDLLFGGGYYSSDPEGWLNVLSSIPMTFARSNFPPEYYENERINESVYWQAFDRGAAGIVLVMKGHPGDTNTHWGPYDGKMRPMPGMWVSSHKEEEIKALAQSGASATITITGSVKPGTGYNLHATLPGQSDEIILISSHHDSCHKGAVEDGTGIAMVLAQAEAWANVPLENRSKTLVFTLTDGHFYKGVGAEAFAREHLDDIMKKTIININLEHLAAIGVEENDSGELIPQDHGAPTMIFATESPTAISTAGRMLFRTQPDRTMLVHSNLLGDVPPGEAGHFHIESGVDFIHWIGAPIYLLTGEDTLDKVDKELLNHLAGGAAEMVATYMLIPEGYSDYE